MDVLRWAAIGLVGFAAACAAPEDAQPVSDRDETELVSCPAPAAARAFDSDDVLETQLADLGCSAKTLIRQDRAGHAWYVAVCPAGGENAALVATYGRVEPYHLRALRTACPDIAAGEVVDEWDPVNWPDAEIDPARPAPDGAAACPSAARALVLDRADVLENRLAALGCQAKTLVRADRDGHTWYSAFCPRGAENRALVAAYHRVQPYLLRTVPRACAELPAGFVVDEWDPHGDPW